jgi:hypothetical protein
VILLERISLSSYFATSQLTQKVDYHYLGLYYYIAHGLT